MIHYARLASAVGWLVVAVLIVAGCTDAARVAEPSGSAPASSPLRAPSCDQVSDLVADTVFITWEILENNPDGGPDEWGDVANTCTFVGRLRMKERSHGELTVLFDRPDGGPEWDSTPNERAKETAEREMKRGCEVDERPRPLKGDFYRQRDFYWAAICVQVDDRLHRVAASAALIRNGSLVSVTLWVGTSEAPETNRRTFIIGHTEAIVRQMFVRFGS